MFLKLKSWLGEVPKSQHHLNAMSFRICGFCLGNYCIHCLFPSSEMKKPEDFFSISGRIVSKGGTLLPRVVFTAPSEARSVIETQGSKVSPEDTLLSKMEKKSKGLFFIPDVGCMGLSFVLYRVPLTFECSKL